MYLLLHGRYVHIYVFIFTRVYTCTVAAAAREQEVQLIRGSEWQTGVRLCLSGVHRALHQGFRANRRAETTNKSNGRRRRGREEDDDEEEREERTARLSI